MNKTIIFFLFSLLIVVQVVSSSDIEVTIPKYLKGNISSFSYKYSLDVIKFRVEFYNTGSIGYSSRIRLDIFNDSNQIFTGWSSEKNLMPGDRKNFEIYWYSNSTGNFTVKVRSYFANEIFEQKYIIEKNVSGLPEDIFEIKNFRTYNNYVVFDIKSKVDVTNVTVIPSSFPIGWIFEQKRIDSIDKEDKKTISLQYNPNVWVPGNLVIIGIASDEGRYYTESEFELKKETGIKWFFYYIIDNLKLFFEK